MTLVDSRRGIAATYDALSRETGVPIDSAAAVSRLGPPMRDELVRWFPADRVDDAVARYLELYPEHAVAPTIAMPGAHEAMPPCAGTAASRSWSPASTAATPGCTCDHLELDVDEVVGWVWGAARGRCCAEHGAGGLRRRPRARRRGCARGRCAQRRCSPDRCTAEELAAAGTDVVLPDLHRVPGLARRAPAGRPGWPPSRRRCATHGSVLVAFSGGADSAFLLAAAVRALGPDHVVAATAYSDSLPAAELDAARELRGLPRRPGADAARPTRWSARATAPTPATAATSARPSCSTCSARSPSEHGCAHVATGTNADDAVAGFRPGIRAAAERGAVTPLRDAGLHQGAGARGLARAGACRPGTSRRPPACQLAGRLRHRGQPAPAGPGGARGGRRA